MSVGRCVEGRAVTLWWDFCDQDETMSASRMRNCDVQAEKVLMFGGDIFDQ
jgi:hypothetical protein